MNEEFEESMNKEFIMINNMISYKAGKIQILRNKAYFAVSAIIPYPASLYILSQVF